MARVGALRKRIARETQRKRDSSVQQRLLCRRQGTDEACERAFGKTHELVAVNAALVLQAFFDANVNLSVKTVATGIHRSADHRGERGVDEKLTRSWRLRRQRRAAGADRVMMGVVRGTVPRVSQGNLVGECVLCFCVEFLGVCVDDSEVGGIFSRTRPGEISSQRGSHEFVALGRTGGAAVQGRLEVLGQSNKCFNLHGAMVRPSARAGQAIPKSPRLPRGAYSG